MADNTPVQIGQRSEEVAGQAQSAPRDLHDGRHWADETVVHVDKVITDVNSDLAVQIPEGVGASTYGHRSPLGEALTVGTPEAQFEDAEKNSRKK
jgi:hypothetical protein